jgi:Flp pilus assembly protein TadD
VTEGEFATAHEAFAPAEQEAAVEGPLALSFVHQHIGKCYFDQGKLDEARAHFAEALRLRRDDGAEHSLIRSSEVAVKAAHKDRS